MELAEYRHKARAGEIEYNSGTPKTVLGISARGYAVLRQTDENETPASYPNDLFAPRSIFLSCPSADGETFRDRFKPSPLSGLRAVRIRAFRRGSK